MRGNWWLAPAAAIAVLSIFLLLPPIEPLTPIGMKIGGIFLFTIIMWVFVGIGNLPALGYAIFAMPNYAFILPSATVVTAIAAGSGWVPVKFMARYGAIALIPMILLVTFIAYPFAALVLR